MICNQLEQHWMMCRALRLHMDPTLRQPAARYFAAKKTTELSDKIELKAVGYVTEFGTTLISQMRIP